MPLAVCLQRSMRCLSSCRCALSFFHTLLDPRMAEACPLDRVSQTLLHFPSAATLRFPVPAAPHRLLQCGFSSRSAAATANPPFLSTVHRETAPLPPALCGWRRRCRCTAGFAHRQAGIFRCCVSASHTVL